jgi:hypothetical protein
VKKRDRAATREKPVATAPAPQVPPYWDVLERFLDRNAIWIAVALVVLATVRIAATYSSLSHTFDEPAHIACGMEWLERHTYTYETLHPPLARIMTALVPRLNGSHGSNQKSMWDEGLAILFANGSEESTLTKARLGILPFFWILCAVAYCCTRWISGNPAAVIALFLVTMTPAVLAHSGVATTDMGLTAMLLLSIYMGWRWLDEPVLWRALAFGGATGLAVLSKFSALPFLPSVAAVGLAIWWWFERPTANRVVKLLATRAPQFGIAAVVCCLVIWAGYRFSFHIYPAPEFFDGLSTVRKYDANGHLTYLLGVANTVGWPHFYLIALAVKMPLPLLALGLIGTGLLFSKRRFGNRGWLVPSIILGILTFASLLTQIKIGTRHILPVIVALGIAGGCATVWIPRLMKQRGLAAAAVLALLISITASSATAHPDYLAYFNIIASGKPEAFLVDSDLDWGQDTKKLGVKLREVGAKEVYFNQFAPGNLEKEYGFPPIHPLDINGPQVGWNAISLTPLKLGLFDNTRYVYDRGAKFWPDQIYLPDRVGDSYLLFYRQK